jgi:hypothetical protein
VAKAASKFGVSVNKPEYFADTPSAGYVSEEAANNSAVEKRTATSTITQPGQRKKKK